MAVLPAEEGRARPKARAQGVLLGAATSQHQVQPRIAPAGGLERVRQQVDALLLGQPARVQNVDLARQQLRVAQRRIEPVEVDAAVPAADPVEVDPEVPEPLVGCRARRQDDVAGAVELRQREVGDHLGVRLTRAQACVGAELGVVAAEQRQLEDAGQQPGGGAGGPGRAHVDQVVAALRECLGDRGDARDPDLHPRVERHLHLGDGAQPAVDIGVGADHLDVEPGHAAVANLADRVGDAVHRPESVGDHGHARPIAVVACQLVLLAPEERGRGGVWDRRQAGVEQLDGDVPEIGDLAGADDGHRLLHDPAQLVLVDPSRPPVQVAVAQLTVLEVAQQLALVDLQIHRLEPRAQQRERVVGPEIPLRGALPNAALAHHALDDLENRARVGPPIALAVAERSDRKRHRGVRPLRGAALVAVGDRVAGSDVSEELGRSGGSRRLGEGAPDVDPGVVVGPTDRGAAMGLDVHERGQVELLGPGAVARLPDREQLCQPAPVARRQRRLDRIERMRERGRDAGRV